MLKSSFFVWCGILNVSFSSFVPGWKSKIFPFKGFFWVKSWKQSHSVNFKSQLWQIIIDSVIGPLQDPVTWYGINYTGTQMTQWDFQNIRTLTSPARLSFVLEVPLRHLRPSVIYSVPCDQILQRAYFSRLLLSLSLLRLSKRRGRLKFRLTFCSLQNTLSSVRTK